MELPKFNETFLPILDILGNGEVFAGRKLLELVEQKYYSELPAELLSQTTKSGERLIENRIAWGKSYLKKGGMVHYPSRGQVQITEKGKSANVESLTMEKMESDVIDFYKPERSIPEKPVSTLSPQTAFLR